MHMCVHSRIRHDVYDYMSDLELSISSDSHAGKVRTHAGKVRTTANFQPNRHRLDVHFQAKRFDSSTFGSSHVIISRTVTDTTNIAVANK